MSATEEKRIVWLDDQPEAIAPLIDSVRRQAPLAIEVVDKGDEALKRLVADPPPDAFIVDLLLDNGAGDGLTVAATARQMRPLVPRIAVTEHLTQFYTPIVMSLANQKDQDYYPFTAVWEKDRLQSSEGMRGFLDSLLAVCLRERHIGTVVKVEPDYAEVRLFTPRGDEYRRFFETEFLQSCGLSQAGDPVEMGFEKAANGVWGKVSMWVKVSGALGPEVEELTREIPERWERVDLEKIRERFGSVMDEDEE